MSGNSTSLQSSLATETEYVQKRLAEYVNDLLSLGVVGLRLDAAKRKLGFHMFTWTDSLYRYSRR